MFLSFQVTDTIVVKMIILWTVVESIHEIPQQQEINSIREPPAEKATILQNPNESST